MTNKKYRVQAIHFADKENVTVQLQGIGHSGNYSGQWPKDEAAAFPVGREVELTFDLLDEDEKSE